MGRSLCRVPPAAMRVCFCTISDLILNAGVQAALLLRLVFLSFVPVIRPTACCASDTLLAEPTWSRCCRIRIMTFDAIFPPLGALILLLSLSIFSLDAFSRSAQELLFLELRFMLAMDLSKCFVHSFLRVFSKSEKETVKL